jgi:uncharacterized membrane protein YphA (DoxX/SURF4 family)
MTAPSSIDQVRQDSHQPQWGLASRVAFRFCFVYFGLFAVGDMVGALLPFLIKVDDEVGLATLWPMRDITFWTAAHIFGAKLPLVFRNSGSDDKTFDWVFAFCLLVFAVLATGLWSALDRRRENFVTAHKWFRVFIRLVLASELFLFGMAKVIPNQMPIPSFSALLTPFGNLSRYQLLWASIGASPAYEIFAGSAEVLAGILLIFPRTTMLGALLGVVDMTEVLMLNMTYDVPVKLFSFHLLLIACFLLAPDFRRLADFTLRNRAVGPAAQTQLFNTRRANRYALATQVLLGIWLLGMNTYAGWARWHETGGGRPKSPLYGIWTVDELSLDGQLRSPLLVDSDRWRRVVFDLPNRMILQRVDDSLIRYSASINLDEKTIALTKNADKSWKANFAFQHAREDQLILDGEMDNHKIHVRLGLVDNSKLRLLNHGFHWIQEY